jgi:hypothetical protein
MKLLHINCIVIVTCCIGFFYANHFPKDGPEIIKGLSLAGIIIASIGLRKL